jgi:hypothetical protein
MGWEIRTPVLPRISDKRVEGGGNEANCAGVYLHNESFDSYVLRDSSTSPFVNCLLPSKFGTTSTTGTPALHLEDRVTKSPDWIGLACYIRRLCCPGAYVTWTANLPALQLCPGYPQTPCLRVSG